MVVRCVGAYERRYHTGEEARKDWDEMKDFRAVAVEPRDAWIGGPYFSKSDQDAMTNILVKLEVPGIWYQLK